MAKVFRAARNAIMALVTFAFVVALLMSADGRAQTTNYYGSDGSYLGQSYTNQNGNTNYYGQLGQYQGQATINRGGTTNYYDGLGGYQGSSQTVPWSRY